ncbi:hypothetical protein GWI33_004067 [Rhynchophorus ferrugineus]|uniref:Carboxylic ester hydrolase n=1 Tax=Rhynchophorus ferrugineus TaxID=354439 RepID=A0A834MEZ0_RHYFE|nr:hypothetical protein GWI33_004067 [Rhynchophorus ferrugineus]
MRTSVIILISLTLLSKYVSSIDLVVEIESGKVQGSEFVSSGGAVYYSWRGIPYAKPPLGDLRFDPPQKPDPWSGILNATESGPACIYASTYPTDPLPSAGNDEDCLTISVYSPGNSGTNDTLPVLVWIYGGGFVSGNSDFNFYDPSPFLDDNVIVVSFNYRLGVFGFLSTGDEVISGNSGLKDQLLALNWTKNNIINFGGDPDRITIFGQSAGSRSVSYHIISPKSSGLFNAAIMESGCALSYIEVDNPRDVAYILAEKFSSNITNASDTSEVKNVLQSAPTEELLAYSKSYNFGPILEKDSDEAFLDKPLYELIASGNISQLPVIIGYTAEETLDYFSDLESLQELASYYDENLNLLVPSMLLNADTNTTKLGEEIRTVYAGEDINFGNELGSFIKWYSDQKFVRSIYKFVALYSQYVPLYMYRFNFYGTTSLTHLSIPGAGNVSHADEVPYLFNVSTHPLQTDADYLTRRRLVKLWTNFAKTHDPTPDNSSELLQNVKWELAQSDNIQFLNIDNNLEMTVNTTQLELAAFWNNFWETYSYHPYNTF